MKTRKGILIAVGLVAILAFGGISGARSVSIIGPFQTWGPELQQAFAEFTEKTGIEVEVIMATGWDDLFEKVVTMSAAGNPPDVVYGDNLRIMDLAERGLLSALDGRMEADGFDLAAYPPPVIEGLRLATGLYSLPTAVSIHALIYNIDTFEQMGLAPLPTDWLGDELGWDEFVAIAKRLTYDTNSDGVFDHYALPRFGYDGGYNMIGMWGAQDVDFDRTQYLGNDASVVRAMEQSTSLWLEHNVIGGNFVAGTAAMDPIQPNQLNVILQAANSGNRLRFKTAVLPKGDVRASQASFHSLGITSGSVAADAAWDLVQYLAYDPEGVILFTRAENRVPVLREPAMDFVMRWSESFPGSDLHVMSAAVQVLWDWRVISGHGGSEILTLMRQAWNRIRTREASVQQALEDLTPLINTVLQGR